MSQEPDNDPRADDPADPADPAGRAEPVEAAEFTVAMHRAAEGLAPADGWALVSAGHARGRTLRRRRAAVVTAGVAVLALAGTGGVLAAGAGHGSSGASSASTDVAAAPRLTRGGGTTAPPATSPAVPAAPPVSARQMEDLLVSLLPHGKISGRVGRGTDDSPYAHVVFDDGHGASAIEVGVDASGQAPPSCDQAASADDSCTLTHVRGGVLTVEKGYEYSDHRVDTKDWIATFTTKDGAGVTVQEWNAAAEKDAPVSRPHPPLSASRLGAVATSPQWNKVIAAIASADGTGAPSAGVAATGRGAIVE